MQLPVRWDPLAKKVLDEIYDYIAQDSETAARHVKKSLIQLGNSLGHLPLFGGQNELIRRFRRRNYDKYVLWHIKGWERHKQ